MSGRSFLPVAASALLAWLLACPPLAARPQAGPSVSVVAAAPKVRRLRTLRVMPMGDSITHGIFGYASYRYPLWERLRARHPVDFVGRLDTVAGEGPGIPIPALYPDYYGAFEAEHEGYAGARTDQLLELTLEAALAGHPDVVLLQIGTNDVGQLGTDGLAAGMLNLPRIVHTLRAANPAVRIVLAQIPPIGPGTGHFEFADLVPEYNEIVASVAQLMDDASSPIEVVDHFTGYDLATNMQADGLHPNEVGEGVLAQNWEVGFEAVLLRSGPAPVLAGFVSDPDFEQFGLADGEAANAPVAFDWGFGLTALAVGGVFNPKDHTYPGSDGAGTPLGASGDEVMFLGQAAGPGERAIAYQTLPTTLSAGHAYSLSVAVGRRLDDNPFLSIFGGYRVELLAGSTVLVSEADAIVPPEGSFQDVTVDYVADDVDPRLLGTRLTVRLSLTSDVPLASTDFDRVRLSVQ